MNEVIFYALVKLVRLNRGRAIKIRLVYVNIYE